jgi:hypothetical protein
MEIMNPGNSSFFADISETSLCAQPNSTHPVQPEDRKLSGAVMLLLMPGFVFRRAVSTLDAIGCFRTRPPQG